MIHIAGQPHKRNPASSDFEELGRTYRRTFKHHLWKYYRSRTWVGQVDQLVEILWLVKAYDTFLHYFWSISITLY